MNKYNFLIFYVLLFLYSPQTIGTSREFVDDNEFAEFDVLDEEEIDIPVLEADNKPLDKLQDKPIQEAEKDDIDISDAEAEAEADVTDEEENEEFDDEFESIRESTEKYNKAHNSKPGLLVTNRFPVPQDHHFYYVECFLLVAFISYLVIFVTGVQKNNDYFTKWFNATESLLSSNFALIGEKDVQPSTETTTGKELEHLYTIWCSGRTCCEGMLVELRLLRRQDLILGAIDNLLGYKDEFHFKFALSKEDMDSYIFCIANKKMASKFAKEVQDLSTFCPERKNGEKFELPSKYNVLSEIGEATCSFIDSRTVAVFNKYSDIIDYIHVSDRYSGLKPEEATPTPSTPIESKRMFLVGLSLPPRTQPEEAAEKLYPLMQMLFYWLEKIKRFRLSKEGKFKSEKNRNRLVEVQLKTTASARNERAMARREEKTRKEKERMLKEDDPEKQRKWEEKVHKKEMKRKTPKVKQLKVKSL